VKKKIKLFIADDSKAVRDSLNLLFSSQDKIEVVGVAADGFEALQKIETTQPDVALLDIRMPHLEGLELASILKERLPQLKIVILTLHEEREKISSAAKKGVDAFLIKGEPAEKVIETVRRVYAGERSPLANELKSEKVFSEMQVLSEKLRTLEVLTEAGKYFASSRSLNDILIMAQNLVPKIAETKHIILRDENGEAVWISPSLQGSKIVKATRSLSQRARKRKSCLFIYDLEEVLGRKRSLEKFKTFIACPLRSFQGSLGTLECLYESYMHLPPHVEEGLYTLASQIALAIEEDRLRENLKQLFLSTIKALSTAIEAKEPYLKGHSQNVSRYAVLIGKALKLPQEDVDSLELAGILHDIGKIGVDDSILKKKGPLTKRERKAIEKHPVIGAKIIESVTALGPAIETVLYHHERWDGHGYPKGLAGEEIPLLARILGIADAYDAMTTERVYRPALTQEEAVQELKSQAGKQFDPRLVKVFVQILKAPMASVG
jgi:HD-GYP domain-containing protein (c-di-GMP phosphodiesterase class II)